MLLLVLNASFVTGPDAQCSVRRPRSPLRQSFGLTEAYRAYLVLGLGI